MENREIMKQQRNPYALRDLKQMQFDLARGVTVTKEKLEEAIKQLNEKYDSNSKPFVDNHKSETLDNVNNGNKSL